MTLVRDSELQALLRDGKIQEFNARVENDPPDLENADLRASDLREAHLRYANLRGAYLRNCDLRGLDLSHAEMDGASIHAARISGTLFPRTIPADEIALSLQQGTRMRSSKA
jgi:uncharacterized protein YjbI with pentapeptide repeats